MAHILLNLSLACPFGFLSLLDVKEMYDSLFSFFPLRGALGRGKVLLFLYGVLALL